MVSAAGWQVLNVKYGHLLRELFTRPGGDALRTWTTPSCSPRCVTWAAMTWAPSWRRTTPSTTPADRDLRVHGQGARAAHRGPPAEPLLAADGRPDGPAGRAAGGGPGSPLGPLPRRLGGGVAVRGRRRAAAPPRARAATVARRSGRPRPPGGRRTPVDHHAVAGHRTAGVCVVRARLRPRHRVVSARRPGQPRPPAGEFGVPAAVHPAGGPVPGRRSHRPRGA